ncbi:MAG: hypothetical protein WCP77_13545 [Roseococcus sp.]
MSLDGDEKDGLRTFSRITVWNEEDERKRTYSISRIVWLEKSNGQEITGSASIRIFLLELAGVATDAEREAAGLEAADLLVENDDDEEEIIARKLRIRAWIEYEDSEGKSSSRHITVVTLYGHDYEGDGIQIYKIDAYCHMRLEARTFLVHRITAVAEISDALAPMDSDAVERWLRKRAGKETAEDRRFDREAANPTLRDRRERREARQRAAEEARVAAEVKRLEAWSEAIERRRNLAAGKEHAVVAQRASVKSWRPGVPSSEETCEGFVIGYDTNSAGQPTVIFFASRTDAKRGRAVYIHETRSSANHLLIELRAPPEAEPIPDPATWVSGVPQDPARVIPPHG